MSHGITNSKDMAYVGDTPWHGLGNRMRADASIAEWAKDAGIDFEVGKAPVHFDPTGNGAQQLFRGRVATFRKDNHLGLGIVGSKYCVHQPGELVEFIRQWAAAAGVKIETMGSLHGGARIWALARLSHEVRLPGNDISRPYFLITTSFNGETGTIGTFTMIRVVCWNTQSAALQTFYDENGEEKKGRIVTGFSYPHVAKFDPQKAVADAQNLLAAAKQYEADTNLMAQAGVNDEQATRYFVGLVGSLGKDKKLTRQSREKIDRLMVLYRTGPGAELKSAKGTVFGMLQAVTRFVDHEARAIGSKDPVKQQNNRLSSAWFGTGRDLKADAMKEALLLAA